MTVLTLPSTGFKSDKVPLVDHVDAAAAAGESCSSPPPPYGDDPKLLECGGERGGDRRPSDRYGLWACRGVRLLLALMLCGLLVWLTRETFCKAYDDTAYAMGLRRSGRQGDDVDDVGDDDATAARVPCKSYTSYAAAEDDMLSMVPSPAVGSSDYDSSQFNAMEDVYKKLENFALNKALADDRKKNDGDDDDGGDQVVSVFNGGVEIGDAAPSPQQQIPQQQSQPPAVVTKSARFIHDFSVNVTGIVDVEGRRCFVMPLVRDAVLPPVSLFDLLFKMSSGYYSMDITKVMANMRVVKPALKDLSAYGLYISKDCADYSTFKLEKAVSVPAVV